MAAFEACWSRGPGGSDISGADVKGRTPRMKDVTHGITWLHVFSTWFRFYASNYCCCAGDCEYQRCPSVGHHRSTMELLAGDIRVVGSHLGSTSFCKGCLSHSDDFCWCQVKYICIYTLYIGLCILVIYIYMCFCIAWYWIYHMYLCVLYRFVATSPWDF